MLLSFIKKNLLWLSSAQLSFNLFLLVLTFIVYTLIPEQCGCTHSTFSSEDMDRKVNMSGVFFLETVENYGEYLLAMEIPENVVDNLKNIR